MQPRYSTTPKVYEAIVQVQEALSKDGIVKNRKNQAQGYAFRGIDDIYNALANHLAAARLCILPRVISRQVTERETKNGGLAIYVVVEVEFDFVCALDGSVHIVRMAGEAMDTGDKATNKAQSAAYKYACLQTFCIPTEADNDADAHTHTVAAKQITKPLPPGLKVAKDMMFPRMDMETGEVIDDDLPRSFNQITPKEMRYLITQEKWDLIGNHEIITKCSRQGHFVKDVIVRDEKWVMDHIEEFTEVDQMALEAYAQFSATKR